MKAAKVAPHKPREKTFRKTFLFTIVFVTSFFYIFWRLFFTLPTTRGVVSIIFGVILWVSESATVLETFTHFMNARKVKIPEMPVIEPDMYPDVDVLIATHNESAELLYKTVNGCKFMKYPDPSRVHVYLCDDKDRPEIATLAQEMGIGYFGLSGNQYAKAGNLNNALPQTHSPLIAIFDADMIPTSDFLLETVPYFFRRDMINDKGRWRMRTEQDGPSGEKELGYVQTQQSFYNPDPLQRNLYKEDSAPNEQDYFYRSVNVSRMATDSAAFAGSNTLFSRKALEEIGGFEVHSITEDFVTGISILGRGYTSIAVPKELAHGLSPEDVYSFIKQRQRWSRGAAQGITNKKFWHSGLKLKAKWNFLVSYFYWWTFVRRFIFILCPILYGVFNIHVADVSFLQLIAVWFPYYIIYNIGLRNMSGGTTSALWSDTIDTIQFPYMMWPIIAGTLMIPQKKFFVTPKGVQAGRNSSIKLATPHIILALLSLFTIIVCVKDVLENQNQGSIIVLFWASYNLYALLNAIIYYFGRSNNRQTERMPIILPVEVRAGDYRVEGITADISEGGLAVKLAKPEYLPIDNVTVNIAHKDYRTTMEATVVQVQQMQGGEWKYSLKITEIDEDNWQQYLQVIYDRDHFFPRTIDMGIVKDMRKVFRGLTSKAKQGERRLPRINMYARMESPEAGTVYVVNFNYRYILLHAKGALPERLQLDFSDTIRINCIRQVTSGPRQSSTELYEVENWEALAVQPAFRARVLQLADEAAAAEETPEMAAISERKRREKQLRKVRNRRRLRVAFTAAAFIALYLALLPDAARELAEQTGISPDMIKAMYQDASAYLEQGDYGEAVRALTDIRSYKSADQKYEDAVVNYRLTVLDEAQALYVAGQYPEAIALLNESMEILGEDSMVASKLASLEDKYIQDSFARADVHVDQGAYEDALAVLHALEDGLGHKSNTVVRKVDEVLTAYRGHYLALAEDAYEKQRFSDALALLDEGEARAGTSDALVIMRDEIVIAYKDDFHTRADTSMKAARYDDAIATLAEAIAIFPEDAAFPEQLLVIQVEKACAQADDAAAAGDYTGAIAGIDAAMETLGSQEKLLAKREALEAAYALDTVDKADKLMQAFQYDEAIALLSSVQEALPQYDMLAQKQAEAETEQVHFRWLHAIMDGAAENAMGILRQGVGGR